MEGRPGRNIPPPPWYYPEGIELPEKMGNLIIGLHKRGYSRDEIKGILGLNMMLQGILVCNQCGYQKRS